MEATNQRKNNKLKQTTFLASVFPHSKNFLHLKRSNNKANAIGFIKRQSTVTCLYYITMELLLHIIISLLSYQTFFNLAFYTLDHFFVDTNWMAVGDMLQHCCNFIFSACCAPSFSKKMYCENVSQLIYAFYFSFAFTDFQKRFIYAIARRSYKNVCK